MGQALPSLRLQLGGQHSPSDPAALPRCTATPSCRHAGFELCLLFQFSPSRPEECKKVELLFQKSGQAGHYTSTGMCGQRDPKNAGQAAQVPSVPRGQWEVGLAPLPPSLGEGQAASRQQLRQIAHSCWLRGSSSLPRPQWGTFGPGPCVASPDRALDGVLSGNQEKTDLRVMDTDYKHYAIVYTLRDRGQEPSTMLQLYSGCHSGEGHPRAGLGQAMGSGGWQGWCSSSPPRATTSAPQCAGTEPHPRNSPWGE